MRGEVDLAVLDISMPGMTGIQAAQELSRLRPRLRTLILSMHDERAVLARGAAGRGERLRAEVGRRPRPDPGLPLGDARRAVRVSGDRAGAAALARSTTAESLAALTDREAQILALIADGHTSREIAEMLVISPRTVERHRENLRDKLGLRNRVDLTRYAIRAGLIDAVARRQASVRRDRPGARHGRQRDQLTVIVAPPGERRSRCCSRCCAGATGSGTCRCPCSDVNVVDSRVVALLNRLTQVVPGYSTWTSSP